MKSITIKRSNKKNIAYVNYEKIKNLCYVGKNGIGIKKREGDFTTPKGVFRLKQIFIRKDRVPNIKSGLPIVEIKRSNIWCVDPRKNKYNSFLYHKRKCLHEEMFREDSAYDIVITTSFNMNPSLKYKGSAIFIHCINKNKFTEGCIAMEKKEIIKLLPKLSPLSFLSIR